MLEMLQTGCEAPPDVRLRYSVATLLHAHSDARHRKFRCGQSQKDQFHAVAEFAPCPQAAHIGQTAERCLNRELTALLQVFADHPHHQLPGR